MPFNSTDRRNLVSDTLGNYFNKETEYLYRKTISILKANNIIYPKNPHTLFIYNNKYYPNFKSLYNPDVHFLSLTLYEDMEGLEKRINLYEDAKRYVKNYLTKLLSMCDSTGDLFYLCPPLFLDHLPFYAANAYTKLTSDKIYIEGLTELLIQDIKKYLLFRRLCDAAK